MTNPDMPLLSRQEMAKVLDDLQVTAFEYIFETQWDTSPPGTDGWDNWDAGHRQMERDKRRYWLESGGRDQFDALLALCADPVNADGTVPDSRESWLEAQSYEIYNLLAEWAMVEPTFATRLSDLARNEPSLRVLAFAALGIWGAFEDNPVPEKALELLRPFLAEIPQLTDEQAIWLIEQIAELKLPASERISVLESIPPQFLIDRTAVAERWTVTIAFQKSVSRK